MGEIQILVCTDAVGMVRYSMIIITFVSHLISKSHLRGVTTEILSA